MANLRELLLQVRDEAGMLTPATVVAAATPEDHPLHHRFEWDDEIAGHKYRLAQAGSLMREVRIVFGPKRTSVRALVNIQSTDGTPIYVPVEEAVESEISSAFVLSQFLAQMEALRLQYEHIKGFRDLVRQQLLGETG